MTIAIYDTTLRDGTQREGISLSLADKLKITRLLDNFGVTYIEGGWPGSNPKDIEFFDQARRRRYRQARIAAFGSTRRKQVAVEQDDQGDRCPEQEQQFGEQTAVRGHLPDLSFLISSWSCFR